MATKIASISGEGIENLLTALSNVIPKVKEKKEVDHFRMFIDRIFNVKGIGFVLTGSVLEGKIEVGKELYLLPGKNKKVKVLQKRKLKIKENKFKNFENNFNNKNFDDPIIKNMWEIIDEFNISLKIIHDLFDGIKSDIKEKVKSKFI